MFTEDLAAFLDSAEGHALDATYDGATAVQVIFDNEYDEGLGIAGTAPVATGLASVFPKGNAPAGCIGKTLLIGGTTYTIRGREPIDDGVFVRLRLKAP